ncbi:hypothetical protein [Longispora fulva]|uniref:Uncharacterized protein n=1 Tax=Longispora fulva TaxID=619741 RepID=A0A8J7G6M8_9ACTN|nr:hypothetical protein [Longispora fulva]MBG6133895.1 hypothetical protein [Longispora fulva]
MSSRTRAAIRRVEEEHLWPGAVADGIERFQRYLRQPGRDLRRPWADCPCCDPLEAREELGQALRLLPRGARIDLEGIVDRLDANFLRRTTWNPQARFHSAWAAGAWWRQRFLDV